MYNISKLIFITFSFFIANTAMSQQQYDNRDAHSNDDYFITSWRNLKNSITNYDLALSNIVPTGDLLKGLSLSPQYEKGSDLSNTRAALHHSTVDVWKLKLKANTDFLNLKESLGVNLEIGKDITYIQQFKTKSQSIFRLPYNPLTKLPIKSDIFFKQYADKSLVYKEGDLLVFKAPMILSFGKGIASTFLDYANVGPGVSYSLAGIFNIQVFRMKNNHVRVTINNSLEKSFGLSFGVSIIDSFLPAYHILGFNALGAVISNNFFNPNFIQFGNSHSNLVNRSYDFIFNLNSAEARQQYDLLMGPKLSLFGSKNYEVIKKTAGLYRSNDQISKKLEIDFSSLTKMSTEDANKPVSERRIFTLSQGDAQTKTESTNVDFNLLKFFSYHEGFNESIAVGKSADLNTDLKSFTFMSSGNNTSMDSFFKWRSRSNTHTNILFDNDEENKPRTFRFLHQQIYKEDRTTKLTEFLKFKNLFLNDLPDVIQNTIKWPEWHNNVKKRHYATLRKEIFINDKIFKSNIVISPEQARLALDKIINSKRLFHSDPIIQERLLKEMEPDEMTSYIESLNQLDKYKPELDFLPKLISHLFNGVDYIKNDNQFGYLEFYLKKAPLLQEIGVELILKCLSEDDLKKVVFINMTLNADHVAASSYQFPLNASTEQAANNQTAYKDYVSYHNLMGRFNFINDKSYRLWLYFNPNSSIIDLSQIITK